MGSSSATEAAPRRPRSPWTFDSHRLLLLLERYMLVLLLVVIVVSFSIATPDLYPTMTNLRTTLGNQSVGLIVALAAMIPLVAGQFDFSVGAVLGLTSIVAAAALSSFGLPVPVAILLAILAGALVGAINGLIVTQLDVTPLITTLGTSTVIAGLIELYTGGETIVTGIPESLTDLGSGNWLGLPKAAFFAALVAVFVWYLLTQTPFGRYLYAIGSNASAARLVGLPVNGLVISSFVAAGALAGVAGALNLSRTGVANPLTGPDFTLPALAAVFLGATTIRPGRFNVMGTIVALLFLAASVTGLTFLQVGPWVQPVFNGTALVLGVGLSRLVAKRREGGGL